MSNKFERDIISEINKFRQEPTTIKHQIEVLRRGLSRLRARDPFLREIDSFIEELELIPKMKSLEYNKQLSEICAQQVQLFCKDPDNYNRYCTGSDLKNIITPNYENEKPALIADEGADEADTVVTKLLLNKGDVLKKGREMLCTESYGQIGIASTEYKEEKYIIIIFVNNFQPEEEEPELPNIDLSELKQAYDLFDHEGIQRVNIPEVLEAMKSLKFDKMNPQIFNIMSELKDSTSCSWNKFAVHIVGRITDKYSDEGIRTIFNLFVDNPKRETISFDHFKKICDDLGEPVPKELISNMLKVPNEEGRELTFDDFYNYMKQVYKIDQKEN